MFACRNCVSQLCLTTVSHNCVSQLCLTTVSHNCASQLSHICVSQLCLTTVSQLCLTTRIVKHSCTTALFAAAFIHIRIYTGCPRRNVPDFGRVFLMLKYTDITQNTYVQSWTVREIMAREKCGLLVGPRTVPVSWQVLSMFVLECGVRWRKVSSH